MNLASGGFVQIYDSITGNARRSFVFIVSRDKSDRGNRKCGPHRIAITCMWRKKNIGEKENVQIKGMISTRMLIISYSIQQVILNVCTKLQNPR